MCPTNDGIEGTDYVLLLCPSFVMHRRDLLTKVLSLVRPFEYISLSNKDLTQLLLFGGKDLANELNRKIIELTLRHIHNTGRLINIISNTVFLQRSHHVTPPLPSPFSYIFFVC